MSCISRGGERIVLKKSSQNHSAPVEHDQEERKVITRLHCPPVYDKFVTLQRCAIDHDTCDSAERASMSDTTVKNHCIICSRPTNHLVLSEHTESGRDEDARDLKYQIIRCAGCNHISFREVCIDLETTYVDESGKISRIPEAVQCYPKFIKNHKRIDETHSFPPEVANVYNEVLHALQEEAFILAGMGLRLAIEAICRDQGIRGKNLRQKIGKLAAEGYISKRDAVRLRAVRFMGDDPSQEIVGPGKQSIEIALQILEHLLSTVYILANKPAETVSTSVSKPDSWEDELDPLEKALSEEKPGGNGDNGDNGKEKHSPQPEEGWAMNAAQQSYLIWRMNLRNRLNSRPTEH